MEIITNRVLVGSAGFLLVLWAMLHAVSPERLLILMNGALAGCGAAIMVAYGPLLWNALWGVRPYDRVRQMTLGFFLCWASLGTSLIASIYVRAADLPVPTLTIVCVGRALAIIAAVLQVTAPDFGLGIFHGRDRKVLSAGIVIGVIVAVLAVYGQEATVLAAK